MPGFTCWALCRVPSLPSPPRVPPRVPAATAGPGAEPRPLSAPGKGKLKPGSGAALAFACRGGKGATAADLVNTGPLATSCSQCLCVDQPPGPSGRGRAGQGLSMKSGAAPLGAARAHEPPGSAAAQVAAAAGSRAGMPGALRSGASLPGALWSRSGPGPGRVGTLRVPSPAAIRSPLVCKALFTWDTSGCYA